MNSKVIKNLYKYHLKIAHKFGYIYGSQNIDLICDNRTINKKRMTRLYKRDKLGPFLGANIKFHYEIGKRINNEIFVGELIDRGFSLLKTLNAFNHNSKKIKKHKTRRFI